MATKADLIVPTYLNTLSIQLPRSKSSLVYTRTVSISESHLSLDLAGLVLELFGSLIITYIGLILAILSCDKYESIGTTKVHFSCGPAYAQFLILLCYLGLSLAELARELFGSLSRVSSLSIMDSHDKRFALSRLSWIRNRTSSSC